MIVQLRTPQSCGSSRQASALGAFEWPSLPDLRSLGTLDWKTIAIAAVVMLVLWKGLKLGSGALADRRKRRRAQLERREQLRHESALAEIARRYA